MSTISSGDAKRSFISGTRLWPPASTLASSPPSRSSDIASSRERGAAYRNRDGYIHPPLVVINHWSSRTGLDGLQASPVTGLSCRAFPVRRSPVLLAFGGASRHGCRLPRVPLVPWFPGLGVADGDRAVVLRVGARLLVRRPRPGHRLPGDLQVIHQLWPGPYRGALAGLGRVLDELEQAGIPLAMPAGLDPHAHAPTRRRRPGTVLLIRAMLRLVRRARNACIRDRLTCPASAPAAARPAFPAISSRS